MWSRDCGTPAVIYAAQTRRRWCRVRAKSTVRLDGGPCRRLCGHQSITCSAQLDSSLILTHRPSSSSSSSQCVAVTVRPQTASPPT